MSADGEGVPAATPTVDDVVSSYHLGPFGRVRARCVGEPRAGVPEIVVVQGMAVSDYLVPALCSLGRWTRARLVDLPGLAGSGEPPRPLVMADYAAAVADYLDAAAVGPLLLAGHSAGTQVAAHAARRADVAGLVLASPTIDPVARTWPTLVARFLWNRRKEAGSRQPHGPEWRRAGPRKLYRFVAMSLADHLEDSLAPLDVPVLVLRGREDRLSTSAWAGALATTHPGGFHELPGAHSLIWTRPDRWSPPIRTFADDIRKDRARP